MATRPIWTGYLRLSLVSCPIRIYPATNRSERISLHLLNPETHSRVSMRPHDAETGEDWNAANWYAVRSSPRADMSF